MVAKTTGFHDHWTSRRAENGEAAVDDDSFVCWKLNHRARLNDEFIRNGNGVGAAQRLCSRPRGLSTGLNLCIWECSIQVGGRGARWEGMHHQWKEKKSHQPKGG